MLVEDELLLVEDELSLASPFCNGRVGDPEEWASVREIYIPGAVNTVHIQDVESLLSHKVLDEECSHRRTA